MQEDGVDGCEGEGEEGDVLVYGEDLGDAGGVEELPDGHGGFAGFLGVFVDVVGLVLC